LENQAAKSSHSAEPTTEEAAKENELNAEASISQVTAKPMKPKLPKRLAALCALLAIASISGIIAKQGVLFCIITLLMVVAILGRQRTAMYMLQGYTLIQLALVSMLPVILYDPGNLVVGNPSSFQIGELQGKIPDYIIFALLIMFSMLQVWIAFTAKVKAYFNTKINMNIMS